MDPIVGLAVVCIVYAYLIGYRDGKVEAESKRVPLPSKWVEPFRCQGCSTAECKDSGNGYCWVCQNKRRRGEYAD